MNVNDAANFFIDICDDNDSMTNLRLNKLLYFAQGWSLARTGKPLFNNNFEAWKFGPVVPEIYRKYKPYGKNPIDQVDFSYNYNSLSNDDYELLIDVAREYGKYSAGALVDISHDKPWKDAHNLCEGEIINQEKILSYFKSLPALQCFNDTANNADVIEGRRDSDGVLVLPKELDDGWQL
jgi:uncharacterized phage-associated protein